MAVEVQLPGGGKYFVPDTQDLNDILASMNIYSQVESLYQDFQKALPELESDFLDQTISQIAGQVGTANYDPQQPAVNYFYQEPQGGGSDVQSGFEGTNQNPGDAVRAYGGFQAFSGGLSAFGGLISGNPVSAAIGAVKGLKGAKAFQDQEALAQAVDESFQTDRATGQIEQNLDDLTAVDTVSTAGRVAQGLLGGPVGIIDAALGYQRDQAVSAALAETHQQVEDRTPTGVVDDAGMFVDFGGKAPVAEVPEITDFADYFRGRTVGELSGLTDIQGQGFGAGVGLADSDVSSLGAGFGTPGGFGNIGGYSEVGRGSESDSGGGDFGADNDPAGEDGIF